MTIFYRISPNESFHEDKRPIFAHDKYHLVEYCLQSFYKAFDNNPTVVFILDGCPTNWFKLIRDCPFEFSMHHVNFNNQNESYLYQLTLARLVDDVVFFQEDDYVYLPNIGKKLEHAVTELGFVSPYDHPEMYEVQQESKLVYLDHHYRSIPYNTMTWGTHSSNIKKYWNQLIKHGFWDKLTFDELKQSGVTLYSPLPSFATHLHSEYLAPCIDWKLCG